MNTELLQEKINNSGLKLNYLAERCGLSTNGFRAKCNGAMPPFNARQIATLKICLRLTLEEVDEIFLTGYADR